MSMMSPSHRKLFSIFNILTHLPDAISAPISADATYCMNLFAAADSCPTAPPDNLQGRCQQCTHLPDAKGGGSIALHCTHYHHFTSLSHIAATASPGNMQHQHWHCTLPSCLRRDGGAVMHTPYYFQIMVVIQNGNEKLLHHYLLLPQRAG